jgi:VCBS repeat-containing protein
MGGTTSGTAQTKDGQFGKLTLNSNGTYEYELDNSVNDLDGLNDGDIKTEDFIVEVKDSLHTTYQTLDFEILGKDEPDAGQYVTNKAMFDNVKSLVSQNMAAYFDTFGTEIEMDEDSDISINGSVVSIDGTPATGGSVSYSENVNIDDSDPSNSTASYELEVKDSSSRFIIKVDEEPIYGQLTPSEVTTKAYYYS